MRLPSSLFIRSKGILKSKSCHSLIAESKFKPFHSWLTGNQRSAYAGWGMKSNTKLISGFAKLKGVPFYRLEDGFISYLTHPAYGSERFSLIIDDLGIYYDATTESRLERLLNHYYVDDELLQRAKALLADIKKYGISKYNHSTHLSEDKLAGLFNHSDTRRILLVDQTRNDCSIEYGLANEQSFIDMFHSALSAHPDADIYIKTHPDVNLGVKRGYLSELDISAYNNVKLINEDIPAQQLISQMDEVYTVTSQFGFEALLLDKVVHCFGAPFYSNWGLTLDNVKIKRRWKHRSLLEVLAIAYLIYPRYIHPETYERCEYEDLRELLIRQLKRESKLLNTLFCVGFSMWKKAFVPDFVRGEVKRCVFVKSVDEAVLKAQSGDGILLWGRKNDVDLAVCPSNQVNGIEVWRMEDGFIRSVGLGVDLRRPSSLVIDRKGIYFDCQQESELEWILNKTDFSDSLLKDAKSLRAHLLDKRVTKYNIGDDATSSLLADLPVSKKVILVPGQVPGDASLSYGGGDIKTDDALLKAVRENEPEAYILYKPHPDVLTGNREGRVDYCFENDYDGRVLKGGDIFECINRANEVHTITSLTGFEALMQGKKVVTYGAPFYSSWGLTDDQFPVERRTRQLTLDMLVAGALILYPSYMDWDDRHKTNVFKVVENLSEEKANKERDQQKGQSKDLMPERLRRYKVKLGYLLESLTK